MGKPSGWRDEQGQTAAERREQARANERAQLADRVTRRPLSLVKPALVALFLALLIFAFVLRS